MEPTLADVLPNPRRVTLDIEELSSLQGAPFQGVSSSRRGVLFLGNHLSGHSHGVGSSATNRPDIHPVHNFRNGAADRRISCKSAVALRQGAVVYSPVRRDHHRDRKRMPGLRGIVGAQWTRGAVHHHLAFLGVSALTRP